MRVTLSLCSVIVFVLSLTPLLLCGVEKTGPCLIESDGTFSVGGVSFNAIHFNDKWMPAAQSKDSIKPDAGYPRKEGASWILKGKMTVANGTLILEEKITASSPDEAVVEISAKPVAGEALDKMYITLNLPVNEFAGCPIETDTGRVRLPVEFKEGNFNILAKDSFGFAEFRAGSCSLRIEGNGSVGVLDDRKWGLAAYSVRLGFLPAADGKGARIKLKITTKPYDAKSLLLSGSEKLGPCLVEGDGTLGIDDIALNVIHFNDKWVPTTRIKPDAGYPRRDGDVWVLKGKMIVPEGTLLLEEKITANSATEAVLEMSVKPLGGEALDKMYITLNFPVSDYAGRSIETDAGKITLPVEFKEGNFNILAKDSFGFAEFKTGACGMRIESNGSIGIQDDRQYGLSVYSVRLGFLPALDGKGVGIKLKIISKPYDSKSLDLRSAMNRSLSDDSPGGNAGWTGQGPQNDLRVLKSGRLELSGISFDIIDAAKNAGKNCIVFGGDHVSGLANSAGVDTDVKNMKRLYLLHALAWAPPADNAQPIGNIKFFYQDGTQTTLPVRSGTDVGNWWAPLSLPNAQVAWTGENSSAYVGLYLTGFPIDPKPLTRIVFECTGPAAWMIVAAATSNDEIPITPEVPVYIVENDEWRPFEFPQDVVPDSVLDFSFLLDAPAGKHGRVVINGDHFAFESAPDVPVRFYGTNLCGAAALSPGKQASELIAGRLALCGYNAVRLHHVDINGGIPLKDGPDSTLLDPVQLDRLDYFVYCLKKRGIYITTDLLVSRSLNPEELPEITGTDRASLKALALFSEAGRRNWEAFAKNLLNHVNPYTGLAWKDDPALNGISLINEDRVFELANNDFEAKFNNYLAANKLDSLTPEQKSLQKNIFMVQYYNQAYGEMKNFLRSIGLKAPLTDQNIATEIPVAYMRNNFDYVDNHFYYDHPGFPQKMWELPSTLQNRTSIDRLPPIDIIPTRIFGKPFAVTEFNWPFPSSFRAESGPVFASCAALQDWGAVYRFDYSCGGYGGEAINPVLSNYFDGREDPINLLSDRIGAAMFLRRDVKSSQLILPIAIPQTFSGRLEVYPAIAAQLGFLGKVGSVVERDGRISLPQGAAVCFSMGEMQMPAGITDIRMNSVRPYEFNDAQKSDILMIEDLRKAASLGKGTINLSKNYVRSSTGELEINGETKTFKAITPQSETLVVCGAGDLSGNFLSVSNKQGGATFSAIALDGKNLADAERILLLHLTDTKNSMMKFADARMTVLESLGRLPYLVRRGRAEIKLDLGNRVRTLKIYAVNTEGKRIGEISHDAPHNGRLSFNIDNFNFGTPCMAYELSFE